MPRGPLSASVGWGELQCHPLLPRMLAFLASSARPSTLRTFPGLRLVGGGGVSSTECLVALGVPMPTSLPVVSWQLRGLLLFIPGSGL